MIPKFKGKVKNGKLNTDRKEIQKYLNTISGDVYIIIKKREKERTVKQNRYYWGVVMESIHEHTGSHPLAIHNFCKMNFLPVGEDSTTNLTRKQFIKYVEEIKMEFAQEWGIEIPEDDQVYYD